MSQWTHPICDACWDELHFDIQPARINPEYTTLERCCECGHETKSGIYMREDPAVLPFHTKHDE